MLALHPLTFTNAGLSPRSSHATPLIPTRYSKVLNIRSVFFSTQVFTARILLAASPAHIRPEDISVHPRSTFEDNMNLE
jgi:hypothetical protein